MIIVAPNSNNGYLGSFYKNSSVTGNWEDFIVNDALQYIENNYRVIKSRSGRGIAGHSMGGYGAFILAMKYPGVFSTVYSLSPIAMFHEDLILGVFYHCLLVAKRASDFSTLNWCAKEYVAMAAAFAPNPDSRFYGDFPITQNGEVIDSINQKWLEHDLYTMIHNHKDNLLSLEGIRFDCGIYSTDYIEANKGFSQALNELGIDHIFEEYGGDHYSYLGDRME